MDGVNQAQGWWFLLPLKGPALDGRLADKTFNDHAFSLVALESHANRYRRAWPGVKTIAKEAGIRVANVTPALEALAAKSWLLIGTHGTGHGYHLQITPTWKNAFLIPRWLVAEGVFGALPPTARTLYLVLRAQSLPGDGSEDLETDWDGAKDRSLLPGGQRHVPESEARPARLCPLCGLSPRTYRKAASCLAQAGLAIRLEDGSILLPNSPVTQREHL